MSLSGKKSRQTCHRVYGPLNHTSFGLCHDEYMSVLVFVSVLGTEIGRKMPNEIQERRVRLALMDDSHQRSPTSYLSQGNPRLPSEKKDTKRQISGKRFRSTA